MGTDVVLKKKAGRKSSKSLTRIIYKNYIIKIDQHSYVLYKVSNIHPMGYYSNPPSFIAAIIEDSIRNKGGVMELKEFLKEYQLAKNEILMLLS